MLFLFVTLILCMACLHLWGNGVCSLFGLEFPRNPFITSWLGLFVLGLTLFPLSFLFPVDGKLSLGVGFASLAGLPAALRQWRNFRAMPPLYRRARWRFAAAAVLVTAVIAAATAYAVWPVHQYDTDLYHAQIVRWLNTYGQVWGLGNVHSRLAHVSTWFDVAALVDNGPWDGRSSWVMVGLLLCLAGLYFLYELCFAPRPWARVYAALMVPMLLFIPETTRPNLSYDTAAMTVHCMVGLEVLYLWLSPPRKFVQATFVVMTLVALSFLIKPLTQVTVIAVSLLTLWMLRCRGLLNWRSLCFVWGLPLTAAALWVGRNLVLSGYPLFPLPMGAVSLDWTVPQAEVTWTYDAVRGYARGWNRFAEALEYGIAYWFPDWIAHQFSKESFRSFFLFPLLAGSLAWAYTLRTRREWMLVVLFAWQAGCLINWFVMAPDPRFGFGFAWSFLGMGAALALRDRAWSARCLGTVFGMAAVLLAIRLGMDIRKAPHSLWITGGIPARPVAAHTAGDAEHPFLVWVPVEGDKCGNAPLPCANKIPERLCLRVPGNLGQGFRPCPTGPG